MAKHDLHSTIGCFFVTSIFTSVKPKTKPDGSRARLGTLNWMIRMIRMIHY